MSACKNRKDHFDDWRVWVRNANYSAFNGYHRTWSPYSELKCYACGAVWRTKADYVAKVPTDSAGAVEYYSCGGR